MLARVLLGEISLPSNLGTTAGRTHILSIGICQISCLNRALFCICSRAYIRAVEEDDTVPVPSPTYLLQNIYEYNDGKPESCMIAGHPSIISKSDICRLFTRTCFLLL